MRLGRPKGAIALLTLTVALAAHARKAQQKQQRTVLTGNTFEDRDDSGRGFNYRFRYSVEHNEAGKPVGVFESIARAGVPGTMPGRSAGAPLHSHKSQEECFTVRQGVVGFMKGSSEDSIDAADPMANKTVCVPPRMPHAFWNAQNTTDLHIDVRLVPPGDSEAFFRTLTGFAHDSGGLGTLSPWQLLDGRGPLSLWQLFATFTAGSVVLEDLPRPVWWAIEKILVPYFIIPVLGVEPFPAEYTAY